MTIWPEFIAIKLKRNKTRNDYLFNINSICDYFRKDFLDITSSEAQKYFLHLSNDKGNPLTIKTLHAKLSSLRSISEFIYENREKYGLSKYYQNVFYNVSLEEFDYYIDKEKIPTIEEMDQLLQACENDDMLFLIFSFILRCALTASEACSLTPKMIRVDARNHGFITFNKRNKYRYVKIPEDVMNLLTKYISKYGEHEYLFYNKNGKPLSIRSLQTRLKSKLLDAGIDKPYTLQDLRNAAIAYMLKCGAKSKDIAEYTGISDRWIYRYNNVIQELEIAPCDYVHFKII